MDVELPFDFREFLRLLAASRVEYLLIGGYAVGYHGYPRATQDLDVWIANNPQNADRVVEALRRFGFDVPELNRELFLVKDTIVRMGVPPIRIEVATTLSGVDFESCYANRVEEEIDGVPVSIMSLSDLKANKKAAGRHKDLDDLEHLP
jgi:predicted nucleotidyltransferase